MNGHEGRVAVVTGAAQGFGQAISRRLAAAGATVIAVDLTAPTDTLAEIARLGGRATGAVADVTDPERTRALGEEIRRDHGRCDILVNNVGAFPFADIDVLDYDMWRKVLAINLDSQFLMTKAVLPLMKEGGWGRIVNLTSNSIAMVVPGLSHYMASKMGSIGFTRGLANDVAAQGITVNAVGPTLSRTPGGAAAVSEEQLEQLAQSQAIKKVGVADDIVGTIVFLTSDDSYFVTGQTIMADGGLVRM